MQLDRALLHGSLRRDCQPGTRKPNITQNRRLPQARAPEAMHWLISIIRNVCSNNVSLAAHLRIASNTFPGIERASLLDPDCFEPVAALKCVLANLFQSAGKRNLFDPTAAETFLSDALHTVRDFDASEICAVKECVFLYFPQRGGKCDALYRARAKNASFPIVSANDLFFPERLQALVHQRALQFLAALKRVWFDAPDTCREDDTFKATVRETAYPDSLETIRKLDVPQARAILECPIA